MNIYVDEGTGVWVVEESAEAAARAYEAALGAPPPAPMVPLPDDRVLAVGEPLCVERLPAREWAKRLRQGSVWGSGWSSDEEGSDEEGDGT